MRLLTIFLLVFSCVTSGQELNNANKVPPCPKDQNARYHNCWGTYAFAQGNKYVGEFKDNNLNGKGTFYFLADDEFKGDIYVGEFKDDKLYGNGTYTFANGDKYVGEFKDDRFDGKGAFTRANGDKYVGEFKDGKLNGKSTVTTTDGRTFENIFENGEMLGTLSPKKTTNTEKSNRVSDHVLIYWKKSPQRARKLALINLDDETAVLRDIQSGDILQNWKHEEELGSTAVVSPNGHQMQIFSNEGGVIIKDIHSGKTLQTWKFKNTFSDSAFSPDGQQILTGSDDGTAALRDIKSGKTLKTWRHGKSITFVIFSPNGQQVLTGSDDGTAVLRNAKSGKTIHIWKHKDTVLHFAFSPNGQQVLTCPDNVTAVLRDVQSGKAIHTWKHKDTVSSVAFSPDGQQVLTVSLDRSAVLRNAQSGKTIHSWKHNEEINSSAFSPNGQQVLTGSFDGTAALRDVKSGRTIHSWKHDDAVLSVAFSPDGQQVLTGSWDQTAVLRDVKSGDTIYSWKHAGGIFKITVFTETQIDLRSALSYEISKLESTHRSLPQLLADRQSRIEQEKPTKSEFETATQFTKRAAEWNTALKKLSSDIQAYFSKLDLLPLSKRALAFERALSRAYGAPELHDIRYDPETARFFATLKASFDPNFKRLVSIAVPNDQAGVAKAKLTSAENGLEVELQVTEENELIWGQSRFRLDDKVILIDYVDKDFVPPNTAEIVGALQLKTFLPSSVTTLSQDRSATKKTYRAIVVCEQSGATPYTEDLVLTALKIYSEAGASYASGFIDTVRKWCRVLKPFTLKPEKLNGTSLDFERGGKHFLRGWTLKGFENFWDSKGFTSLPVYKIYGIVSD